jgi:hypothetical protein
VSALGEAFIRDLWALMDRHGVSEIEATHRDEREGPRIEIGFGAPTHAILTVPAVLRADEAKGDWWQPHGYRPGPGFAGAETTPFLARRERPPAAIVCHVRDGFEIYIGRAGYGFRASKWANPFKLPAASGDALRATTLGLYEEHVRARPELMAALPELRGRRLGCWCAPKACHGDVLVRLLDEVLREG